MADPLDGLRRGIERLPEDVTRALRAVASVTAGRVQRRARDIVNRKVKRGDAVIAITVVDDVANKKFLVIAEGSSDKPANLALWIERGTRYMAARPFMRPAADAEEQRYRDDMERDAVNVLEKLSI